MARGAMAVLVALGMALSGAGTAEARQRLAYEHDGRIYALAADGSGRTLLAAPGRGYDLSDPHWSPDGVTLAYTRGPSNDDDDRSQLMIRDGRGTRALTPLVRGRGDYGPVFSPDGRTIAFSRGLDLVKEDDIETQIVTLRLDGSPPHVVARARLRQRLTSIGGPAWSPDGRLAYSRSRIDRNSYFEALTYSIAPDGTGRRVLLRDGYAPAWSHEGRRLAFTSIRDRNGDSCGSDECSYNGELYVAGADGRGARRLTRNPGEDTAPSWSADDSRVLFTSNRNFPEGPGYELYTITPEGSCLSWLTNGAPSSGPGDWQPGSGTGADAGGCGALGRAPVNETPEPRPAGPALWLGREYDGLLLTDSDNERGSPTFDYADCGRFDPRTCLPGVYLTSTSVCRDDDTFDLLRLIRHPRVTRFRGTVLARDPEGQALPELYTGPIDQTLQIDNPRPGGEGRILDGLYRFGRARPAPGSPLPRPQVSARRAAALRSAVRARRRHPSVRSAARALGVHESTLRVRLTMARALSPLRTTACR